MRRLLVTLALALVVGCDAPPPPDPPRPREAPGPQSLIIRLNDRLVMVEVTVGHDRYRCFVWEGGSISCPQPPDEILP